MNTSRVKRSRKSESTSERRTTSSTTRRPAPQLIPSAARLDGWQGTATRWGAALLLAVLISSCALGREVSGPSTWGGAASEAPAGPRKVYVSNFFEYKTGTSVTGSAEIAMIRETASIKDVSGELAGSVSEAGVSSVAKIGFDGTGMTKDDLWVRGTFQNVILDMGGDFVAGVVVSGVTLSTIGGILPYPFPVSHGNRYKIRVEIINSNREIVFTKDDLVEVAYYSLYIWGVNSRYGDPGDRAEMLSRVGAAIAKYAKNK